MRFSNTPTKKAAEVTIPAISEGSGTASAPSIPRILKENISRLDSNVEVLQSFDGVCGELLGLIEGDF
ncbi:MAG: hypothetical protein P7H58_09930 [Microcoleus anatoxicus]